MRASAKIMALTLNHINEDGGQGHTLTNHSIQCPFNKCFLLYSCNTGSGHWGSTVLTNLTSGSFSTRPLKTLGDWSTFSLKRRANGISGYLAKGHTAMFAIFACSYLQLRPKLSLYQMSMEINPRIVGTFHLTTPTPTVRERGGVRGHQSR